MKIKELVWNKYEERCAQRVIQHEKLSQILPSLLHDHKGKWVVFLDEVVGIYDTEPEAEADAMKYFGILLPFIIVQIKTPIDINDTQTSTESTKDFQEIKEERDWLNKRNNELEECLRKIYTTLSQLPRLR